MEAAGTNGYQQGEGSEMDAGLTEEQLKGLLAELISSSGDLSVRVWLDGVYTNLDDAGVHGDWMKGREVYFKVEGKVDGFKGDDQLSKTRSG